MLRVPGKLVYQQLGVGVTKCHLWKYLAHKRTFVGPASFPVPGGEESIGAHKEGAIALMEESVVAFDASIEKVQFNGVLRKVDFSHGKDGRAVMA